MQTVLQKTATDFTLGLQGKAVKVYCIAARPQYFRERPRQFQGRPP